MMGVLLLGLLLVLALLLCSILRAGLPAALSVASIMVGLMVVAGGGGMAGAIIGGGAILIGGLVLSTASETYEEIRLARRLTKPRRRPRVTTLPEAEPESHEHSRAAIGAEVSNQGPAIGHSSLTPFPQKATSP